MGVEIHLQPADAWQFYQKNKKRLAGEMVIVAENDDTGYSVCMTEEEVATNARVPYFNVYREEEKVYAEGAISEKDCVKTLRDIYLKYLFPVVEVSKPKKEESPPKDDFGQEYDPFVEEKEQEFEDIIYQRDDALFHAMSDFLQVVLNCSDHDELVKEYTAEMISEAVEDFCNYMADIHLISVYHPRWEKNDETGEDYFEEYPHLAVDDDDSSEEEEDAEDSGKVNKSPKRML